MVVVFVSAASDVMLSAAAVVTVKAMAVSTNVEGDSRAKVVVVAVSELLSPSVFTSKRCRISPRTCFGVRWCRARDVT